MIKKIKAFIANLNRSPQTYEEAKKANITVCLLFGIPIAIIAVLFAFASIAVGLICLAADVALFSYLYFGWDKNDKKRFCDQCLVKYDYEKCIQWKKVSQYTKTYLPSSSNNRSITEKEFETVDIVCTCDKCGMQKKFTKKFVTSTEYSDGSYTSHDLEDLIIVFFGTREEE